MKPGPLTIVTGVTRGLGYAMAHELAQGGGHVVTLSRQTVPGLQDLAQTSGTMLTEILVDLVDASALEQAAEQMSKVLSESPHHQNCRLIHNAGIVAPIEPANQLLNLAAIRTAFDVNIVAPIYLTGYFLAATEHCADRRVMLISSGAGRRPTGSWGVYCATKAAMDRYAEVVHTEDHNHLRVCSLAPGVIDTGMQQQIRQTPKSKFPSVGRFEDMHSQGALADATNTAKATLKFLESDSFGKKLLDDIRDHA
ncbi:SDR family NAD(P)-dependent oxidoreductase [Orrella daihaiensis]|uniref:SDR family NAD(P)-dependent oxidoreductase n=1 Tax=Orrella daihaiensis TaxID=2782176 RepID=A0ABY4AGH5_9BURK|nr:SDR family NAD(P)-dependent oxidoreductase [Orrella daihaiensis]UOD49284.1 SDR family NAD(P)-dependent oxidoreductase [Orrella daihaiensis]